MVEVHPHLFIGAADDFETQVRSRPGWWVIHACKEPYHRQLLGYKGRAAPKTDPRYLFARQDRRLYLNLIDADNPDYIPMEIVDVAIAFVDEGMQSGGQVLIHCNLGESRAPSLGLLYLASRVGSIATTTLQDAENDFRRLYPGYNPKGGMRGFLLQNWNTYVPAQA
jgi:predicted protein tyrosine phosphatase